MLEQVIAKYRSSKQLQMKWKDDENEKIIGRLEKNILRQHTSWTPCEHSKLIET